MRKENHDEDAGLVGEAGQSYPERTFVLEKLEGHVAGRAVTEAGIPIGDQSFFVESFYDDGKKAAQLGRTGPDGTFHWNVGRPGQAFRLELRNNGGARRLSWSRDKLEVTPEETLDLGEIVLEGT